MGFTCRDVWQRLANGFWRLKHPSALCGLLGFENMVLVMLVPGDMDVEKTIKLLLPPDEGEFWHKGKLEQLRSLLLEHGGPELPLPMKPSEPDLSGIPAAMVNEKQLCCGGQAKIAGGGQTGKSHDYCC